VVEVPLNTNPPSHIKFGARIRLKNIDANIPRVILVRGRSENSMPPTILVIGAENPRVRDLFNEVGRYAKVSWMNIGPMPRRHLDLSGETLDQTCAAIVSKFGAADVIVFTWPHLAPLAERFSQATRVYYCKDPFEHWACWNREEIRGIESRLLGQCDAVFAVSRLLADDFRTRTLGKVFYLPNGVEESFLNAAPQRRPTNLPTDKPILGSIGQINSTYDWPYIMELAASLPEARLCFVGNVSQVDPPTRQEIFDHLKNTPNILWLDEQPHEQLPAYMQHFDISLCPLKADDYADRRSPLRIYDYLTTNSPIISTPIREAFEHLPHIHIAKTAKEAANVARKILDGEFTVDFTARRQYIAQQTWPIRASQFLEELLQLPGIAGRLNADFS
jgi:glycosyltransferase involved in cell wall biosynthesis